MKIILDMKKIAINNIDGDIGTLSLINRLKGDTTFRKKIVIEKLNLLYSMDIIDTRTYYTYIETINTLYEED